MSTVDPAEFWNNKFSSLAEIPDPEGDIADMVARLREYLGDMRGKRVLDLGCGLGTLSITLASMGADVIAVDISEYAVSNLNQVAVAKGLSVKAYVASAMDIETLGPFDAAVGIMILHHLEPFSQFAARLGGSLKRGAKAFFYENNASSELLIWFREHIVGKLWIPKYGDAAEFPLQPKEIDMLRPYFAVCQEFPNMVFFQLLSTYLLKGHCLGLVRAVDDFLFRRGWLVRYSYRQYVLLEKV